MTSVACHGAMGRYTPDLRVARAQRSSGRAHGQPLDSPCAFLSSKMALVCIMRCRSR